jgi:quinolinate synthase
LTALKEKILLLKKKKNAVILAHYYQEPDIQDVADFVGDSLGLSQQASRTNSEIIVFAGVHFMAETAKILNPGKKVLLPELQAGCSLADSCPPPLFRKFIQDHPAHTVVSYINCSAEVKSMSDIICTSANAVKIISSIPPGIPVIFAPDKNLGRYVSARTGRDLLLWDGACAVHEAFALEKIDALQKSYPSSELIVHPESVETLIQMADFVGSTAAMIDYVTRSAARQFIVATEAGILHKMRKAAPGKLFIPAPVRENNSCACSECPYMKMNTLEKLHNCLLSEEPEIILDETIRKKAEIPLQRMLSLSSQNDRASA